MKMNRGKIGLLAGAISLSLVMPVFANQQNIDNYIFRTIDATEGAELIHQEIPHWAEFELYKMQESFQQAVLLMKGGLDAEISYVDFQNLLRATIHKEFAVEIKEMTREEVVSVLMDLWAKETGQDLMDIVIPMVLVYEDTDQMNYDYTNKIMIAYFNGIAKGKGDGNFKPKDKLTYGEAVTLINRVKESIEGLKLEDNVKGGIVAGSFDTRATYKIEDKEVIFDFELFSNYTEKVEVSFSSGKQFDVVILDEKKEEVYRFSDDKMFTMALIYKTLEPGESIKWQDKWDKTNKAGEILTEGKYTAVITIDAILEEGQEFKENQFKAEIEFNL